MVNPAFNTIAQNLGFGIDFIIWIILTIGLLVIFAKDFKIGSILAMITQGVLFIWFYGMYEAGHSWNYITPLISLFISVVLLALSLLFVGGATKSSGGLV